VFSWPVTHGGGQVSSGRYAAKLNDVTLSNAVFPMTPEMPATRTQMWLARGAIVVCVVLLILLKTIGFGGVTSIKDGSATIYSGSPIGSVMFGVMGIIVCVLAVVFWMQPGRLFTFFSVVLFLLAIYVFVNVPNGLNHRVVVTPDSFSRRSGSWYSPVEHRVDFDTVLYLQLAETEPTRNGRTNYELQCFTKPDGDIIAVPVFDMMKKALPEIYRSAAAHDIVVGENADGWQIPPDLSD